MDEWDNKNNGTGPDAEQTDSANDTHIENNADQMPPYTQQAPYQSSFGAGGYYQQGGPSQNQQGQQPYQSPYQYNQAPASGGGPDGSGPQKKKKKTGLIVLIVILCVALVAAGIGIAIGLTTTATPATKPSIQTVQPLPSKKRPTANPPPMKKVN